jgi:hypothetical protein
MRAVKNLYPEAPLLCEDIVPLVVAGLPFLSPLGKFIGEAAYQFCLASCEGVSVILLFLRIWTVVVVGHCAFLLQYLESIRDAKAGSGEQPSM